MPDNACWPPAFRFWTVAGSSRGSSPSRSYCMAYKVPGNLTRGMYISADSPTRSVRYAPTADGERLIVGGAGHPVGREKSPACSVQDLDAWAKQHYPGAMQTHYWSAQDYTPDRRVALRRTDTARRRQDLRRNGFRQVGHDQRHCRGAGAVRAASSAGEWTGRMRSRVGAHTNCRVSRRRCRPTSRSGSTWPRAGSLR